MVNSRKIDVRIGASATRVGELIHEVSGNRETVMFTYHLKWIEDQKGFPLAPDMPLRPEPYYRSASGNMTALPLPVADGAPDSWGRAIIRMAFRSQDGRGRQPNDLDYLLEADDFLRSGALRYFDGPGDKANALASPKMTDKGKTFSVPRLYELEAIVAASRAFEADPENYRATRGQLIGGNLISGLGSLGGARPKVNVMDDTGQLWIAKLAKSDDTYAMARTEVMALRLATRVGIQASEAKILATNAHKYPIALIKRFDRTPGSNRIPFISGQTFMGLEGAEPGNYVDLAERMREHCHDPKTQMAELYKRMMFTVLIQNADDHLRNVGFIASPNGKWRLSPAFDVNPDPDPHATLKTSISDIHGNDLSIENLIEAAPFFDVSEDNASKDMLRMAETIRDEWRGVGATLGMTSSDYRAIAPAMQSQQILQALKLGQTKTVHNPSSSLTP